MHRKGNAQCSLREPIAQKQTVYIVNNYCKNWECFQSQLRATGYRVFSDSGILLKWP